MRFLIALVTSLAFATPALAAIELSDVQAHLKAVTTMTAHFSQTDRTGKTITGVLQLKRPGKIRSKSVGSSRRAVEVPMMSESNRWERITAGY